MNKIKKQILVLFVAFTLISLFSSLALAQIKETVKICPVMRAPASSEFSLTYKEKVYNFCCPSCIAEFKADPEKYINMIKEFRIEAFQYGILPDHITVKKGDIVRLIGKSRDIEHKLSVKGYNVSLAVNKDQESAVEFIADKAGVFDIACSMFCGEGHRDMQAKFVVEE